MVEGFEDTKKAFGDPKGSADVPHLRTTATDVRLILPSYQAEPTTSGRLAIVTALWTRR